MVDEKKEEKKIITPKEGTPKTDVEKPETITIEIPTPQKTPSTDSPKRKYSPRGEKSSKSTKNNNKKSSLGQTEITALICGVFSLCALKGGEHWAVSTDEAETISQPLSNILEKLNLVEEVAKVSDGAMLLMAVAMITIPRIIISSEMSKAKKLTKQDKIKKELEVKSNAENKSTNPNRESKNIDGGNITSQSYDSINDKTFYQSIAQ